MKVTEKNRDIGIIYLTAGYPKFRVKFAEKVLEAIRVVKTLGSDRIISNSIV